MLNCIAQVPLKYIQRYNMNDQLGINIKALRKRKHLTQEQFAERIGVSSQAVSKWETGEATPEVSKLLSLSKLFGVTTDYLLDDESEEKLQEAEEEEKEELSPFAAVPVYETPKKNKSVRNITVMLILCIIVFLIILPVFAAIFGFSIFTHNTATGDVIILEEITSVEPDEYIIPSVESDESLPYYDDSTSTPHEADDEPIIRFENSAVAESSTSMTNFSVIFVILLFGIPALMIPVLIIVLIILLIKRKRQ